MTRVVGHQQRNEFIDDPAEALRRGRKLDRMLAGALPARTRGVIRATHKRLNELDDMRQQEIARRINAPPHG
jgi:hypothetical protein